MVIHQPKMYLKVPKMQELTLAFLHCTSIEPQAIPTCVASKRMRARHVSTVYIFEVLHCSTNGSADSYFTSYLVEEQ